MKKKIALTALVTLIGAPILGAGTVDRWMFAVLDPGPFDAAKSPKAPDYSEAGAWAALPTTDDAADVALAELPAVDQSSASAVVFYLHPTTWIGKA